MTKPAYFNLIIICCFVCSTSLAEDFQSKTNLQNASSDGTFFEMDMPILQTHVKYVRKETIALNEALLDEANVKSATAVNNEYFHSIGNDNFSLTTLGQGDSASYNNNDQFMLNGKAGFNNQAAITKDKSTDIARTFIDTNLNKIIHVTPNEKIEPFHRLYLRYQDVERNIIIGYYNIFSRTYSNYHIIGPGSKIRINIGINGELIGYKYDWPELSLYRTVKTASREEFNNRLNKLCKYHRMDCSAMTATRFECGIYDYGSIKRENDLSQTQIQPACFIALIKPDTTKHSNSIAFYIPIAETDSIIPDNNWNESLIILDKPVPSFDTSTKTEDKP
ncbi:MAG: hypothetical protein IJM59_04715 [Proteobacteria bacterium]|nr:hypothetical protein [Pseudomonadota bacterium]